MRFLYLAVKLLHECFHCGVVAREVGSKGTKEQYQLLVGHFQLGGGRRGWERGGEGEEKEEDSSLQNTDAPVWLSIQKPGSETLLRSSA